MDTELDFPEPTSFNWKKVVTYTALVAVVVGGLVAKVGMGKGKAEGEFVQAASAFAKWDQIEDLEKIMQKHPELHARYDGPIAQNFLINQDFSGAEPYIERVLRRVDQPYYGDYTRMSLLISKGNYQEALEGAYQLKGQMENSLKEEKDISTLYAFNLLRIATLCQQLNNREGELSAWQEIKRQSAPGHAGFARLLSHFSIQDVNLLSYITSREESLSNQ